MCGRTPPDETSVMRAEGTSLVCGLALGALALRGGLAFAQASGPPPLGLDEVLRSVSARHPQVAAVQQDAAAAQAELVGARGGFDPEVKARALSIPLGPYAYSRIDTQVQQPLELFGASLFGGWRWGRGDIPTYYGNYETNALGELRAGLSVPLLRNREIDRRRAALQRGELGQTLAKLSVVQTRLELNRAASQRYWDWVAAGGRRRIAFELLEIASTRDAQLAQRVSRGDLPAIERTDNQRALLQRQAQTVSATRSLRQAALELSLYLRDAGGAPVVPADERLPKVLPAPSPLAEVLQGVGGDDLWVRRPDLRRLEAQRDQQRVESRLADNQRLPQVDVSVAGSKDLGAGSAKLGKPELELGLALELPTLNRVAGAKLRSTEASVAKLDAQLTLQRDRALADLQDARLGLEAAHARVGLAAEEVAVARELEKGERRRFAQGDSSLLFVNLREQAAAEAAVREIDSLADYWKGIATLEAVAARGVEAEEP